MTWTGVRGRYLFREVNERGYDLPLASVTRHGGVEFRSDLDIEVWNPSSNTSQYKRAKPGDFVIGLRSFQSGIGYSTLEGLVSPAYTVLRPVSSDVYGPFFKHLFKSEIYISRLENVAQGIRQGRTISTEDFYNIPIAVPSVGEQRAIADYLDAETSRIDTLITKKRRMIELLEERWVANVVKTTTSRASRDRVALRHVIDTTIGGAWGNQSGEGDCDAVCIRGTDFDMTILRADGVRAPVRSFAYGEFRRRRLLYGDLIIEKSGGGDKQPVGRVVQWCGKRASVPTNFAARLRPAAGMNSRFLTYVFRAAYETGLTRRWINQTTGIQNLDLSGFLSEKWTVPTLGEQSSIAARLDDATKHRGTIRGQLDTQIDLLLERRQALITAAVTGESVVPADQG